MQIIRNHSHVSQAGWEFVSHPGSPVRLVYTGAWLEATDE